MTIYKLYKGFRFLGEFSSIIKAKKAAPEADGVYNIISNDGHRSSWQMLNGIYYGD